MRLSESNRFLKKKGEDEQNKIKSALKNNL